MTAIAAVVLAAGRSSRYRTAGGPEPSKLVAMLDGEALVRHVVRAASEAGLAPIVVVTGHAREEVESTLSGYDVQFAHNPGFGDGIATSLATGIAALPAEASGAIILLGDMPLVRASTIRTLAEAASAQPAPDAVVPLCDGMRGNPVMLARSLFSRVAGLTGDEGAKRLLRDPTLEVLELQIDDPALLIDIDDPSSLARAGKERASPKAVG